MRYTPSLGLFCVGLLLNSVAAAQSPSGVVRIGILNDQSGPYADFGGRTSVDAARMAVEDGGGKGLGKSVEIIIGDHQNKPDVGSAIARRWFDVDGVSAVVELTNSAVALAVQQIAKEKGKMALFTGPATTRLTKVISAGAPRATGAPASSSWDFPICHTPAAAERTNTVLRLAQTRTEVPPTEMKAAMPAPAFADSDPPLWDGLGSVAYKISTSSAEAQTYFDQGLRLAYAFNHGEAQRAFRRRRGSIRHAPCASGARRWSSAPTSTFPCRRMWWGRRLRRCRWHSLSAPTRARASRR